jgi:LuxR family quorum-sensing system transcriptional regulator CciR
MTDYVSNIIVGFPSTMGGGEPRSWRPKLTARQRECLIWVEQGKSSSDIGVILGLSPETVNEHVGEACRRLGVRTRIQAVVSARALGLFE